MRNNLPYNVMRNPNSWDNVPRMPQALVPVFAGLGFGTTALFGISGLTAASIASYIAVSAITSWAISALAPKPDFSSFGSQGTLVNTRDATAAADFVYGEVRKGGTVTYYESTGDDNKFLHQIIVLAGHEVAEIGDIYINEEVVTLDSNGYVTDAEWVIDGGANPSGIRIFKHDGSQTSTADTFANSATESLNSTLLTESELTGGNALDANFVGRGIAYLYVRYEFDQTVFASGVPLITAKVKGKKVYDPRTGVTGYSNNAALCIRDFITSEYGLNDSAVDDYVFSAAANESDEDVRQSESILAGNFIVGQQYEIRTNASTDFTLIGASSNDIGTVFIATGAGSGGSSAWRSEKRYTINGIIKASSPTGKVLGEMTTACAGTLFWGSGYWKLKVGAYSAPVKTLTLDDLRGPINLNTRSSMRDSFNGVTGTFNNADEDFITMDYPKVIAETSAGSFVVDQVYTITEVGTTDFTAIGALSNSLGVTFTATGAGSGTGKASAFLGEDGGDELLLDLPLPFTTSAATAQRIAKMTLYRGREQMTISADFGLEAFNVEVGDIIAFTNERYGFDEKEFEVIGWRFESNQEAGDLRVNLTLQETSQAAFAWNAEESDIIGNETNLPVANAGLVVNNLTASDSTRLQGDGTAVNSAILAWTAVSSSFFAYYDVEWRQTSDNTYASTTTTENGIEISPLIDGVEYTFRVRAVSVTGATGPYATATLISGGDVTAPGVPTSVSADGGFGTVNVSWVNPADTDLSFVRIYESVDSNVVNATLVGSASGDNFIRANLSPQVTRYYWVSAVDYSGNESDKAGPASATTNRITASDIGPAVITFDNFTLDARERIEDIENEISGYLNGYEGTVQQLTLADMTSLSSDIAGTYASSATLTQNYYTIAGADAAISSAITSFESSFIGDNDLATNASISEVYYTKAETDGAISTSVFELAGQVNEFFARISTVSEVQADVDGIEAKYGVTIDNNGSITGYQLLSGAGGSAFNVRADQFAVFNSTGGGGDNPFTVFTSSRTIGGTVFPAGTYIRNAYIDTAAIVDLSVDTIKVANNSITFLRDTTGNATVYSSGDMLSLTWTPSNSGSALVDFGGILSHDSLSDNSTGVFYLMRDSSILKRITLTRQDGAPPATGSASHTEVISTTGGVSTTLKIRLNSSSGGGGGPNTLTDGFIAAFERFK